MSGLIESLAYNLHTSNSHNLGFLNSDTHSYMPSLAIMDEPSFSHNESDDVSTGYLEDALVEFSSKRRRLLLYHNNIDNNYHNFYTSQQNHHLLESCWNSYSTLEAENFNWINNLNYDSVSAEYDYETSPKSRSSSEDQTNMNLWREMKTPELEAFSNPCYNEEYPNCLSSSSKHQPVLNSQFLAHRQTIFSIDCKPQSGSGGEKETKKKKKKRRVVYPFAMVKPGGVEGDMTLKDINQKILMPPTRPVRHPVGDFACRPCISSDGTSTGLSGKAVVALTRIHTLGRRGTITIIRTKG